MAFFIGDTFDPTDPNSPAQGDGLVHVKHTVYDCIEAVCDHHRVGLLLFKLMFLCRRSTVTIDSVRWYVKSRAALCEEVRLSRHQYDDALKRLKAMGLVETRRVPIAKMHIFGNFTAFRVTPEAIERVALVIDLRSEKEKSQKKGVH